jgi:archaetidylinositol phosphate synthase
VAFDIAGIESGELMSGSIFLQEGTRTFAKARSPVRVQRPFKAQPASRIQKNVMAQSERKILNWLCMRMPSAITPDWLTGIGVVGAGIVFIGYLSSRIDPAFFWLATLGLVVHWFGDSLDGSLARYRGIERPSYGYFLDQSVDAISIFLIMTGLGLSAYIRLEMGLWFLLGYLMLCLHVVLCRDVTGRHQMSFLGFGPTEMRMGLIGLNSWMFFAGNLKVVIGSETFSSYDFILCASGTISICVFVVNMLKVARRLRREDALA